MSDAYAHSKPNVPEEKWEPLGDHLLAVATLAADFALPFGGEDVAALAGKLHDIGKLSPEFQAYIRGHRAKGGDHSSAGARIALDAYPNGAGKILAAIIAAHHAGLADGIDLEARLNAAGKPSAWEKVIGALSPRPPMPTRPLGRSAATGFETSFLIRMLFSCLVDADYLATERFCDGPVARGNFTPLAVLRDRLQAFMAAISSQATAGDVNALRAYVLRHALGKAELSPGLFTLTVPTGGGKTLASLSFALDHALRHGLRRVIYVIPYTSIIEQTAKVFRDALSADADILEHHASFDWEKAEKTCKDDGTDAAAKLRRAAENWDAPIIVTTAVQFFESLFANRTSRCRKLHNIAKSVVILDEAQTLPLPLLRPCLAAVDELARNYGASVVLCTATQPAIRTSDGFKHNGLDIEPERELAPEPQRLYTTLKRVRVEAAGTTTDETIAARFADAPQMLCIVNGRAHAQRLYKTIRDLPGAVHLTTLMCPRHRRLVLDEVRTRLKDHRPVRLVATSLIEAGVDVDFPEVWRAAAGLESIAQAAGRCNREGKLPSGRVVVFEPADDTPMHEIKQRWQATQTAFRHFEADDLLGLEAVQTYFNNLYWTKGEGALDAKEVDEQIGILSAIRRRADSLAFPFAGIARAFQMIDETMEPVIVPWRANADDREADTLLRRIAAMDRPLRDDLRALQQYTVPIPQRARDAWLTTGVLTPVHPQLGEAMLKFADLAHYDPQMGVGISDFSSRLPDANIIF